MHKKTVIDFKELGLRHLFTKPIKELKTRELENIVNSMANSIIEIWSSPEKMLEYSKNAREHARKTHDKEQNFAKLQEIYANIAGRKE